MTADRAADLDWVQEHASGSAALVRDMEAAVNDADRAFLAVLRADLARSRALKSRMPQRMGLLGSIPFVYAGGGDAIMLQERRAYFGKKDTA
jgi:hypothetical protein